MKFHTRQLILIAASALCSLGICLLAGCATNANGSQTVTLGSTSITIPASDVQAADNIASAAITAAINGSVDSLATTGSVNAQTVASSELYSLAATAQANVGNVMPPTVISSSSSVQSIGQTAANALGSMVVTQALVNNLEAAAAKSGPAPTPTPAGP